MNSNQIYGIFESERCRIVTDSRLVQPGDIFFALKGDSFDGNRFAEQAIEKGARLAVVDDPEYDGDHRIVVEDTLVELQLIASRYRDSFKIPVLAITGSNGKTTTKELIAAVLSEKYRVHYTQGNLNNHIGVPLTILSASPDTEFMIIEMGANHKGEIRQLCNIAKPGFGIITNIGRAHLEGFGSPEAVVEAKSELYTYIESSDGVIFYNGNNKLLSDIAGETGVISFTYQEPGKSKVSAGEFHTDPSLALDIDIDGNRYRVETALFGNHNIENILASVACGLYFGIEPDDIVKAISGYRPLNNRSQVMVTSTNRVICDSYNANPTSMDEALTSFFNQPVEKKAVILGDMLELGTFADEEHKKIAERLESIRGADIYLVGPLFMRVSEGKNFRLFNNVEELNNYLSGNPIKNTFVLVKGSRGINLEKVYPFL
jgi:UDP-N-acetylmuramoyl-tripeptide--D-alanyl-D-alanine ligase